jgi:hypothetical protein
LGDEIQGEYMREAKKQNFGCWLGFFAVIVLIGLIIYFSLTGNYEVPQPSTTPPRPGFWRGENVYVYFTITQDGGIEDFHLQPRTSQRVSAACEYIQEFSPTLSNSKIITESGPNIIKGFFATDGLFHGTYSITKCGEWSVSSQEGSWDAEWVTDKAP